jgi:hypothetical protein
MIRLFASLWVGSLGQATGADYVVCDHAWVVPVRGGAVSIEVVEVSVSIDGISV